MNIYVVVEGDIGEKKVYQKWIKYINPHLRYVEKAEDVIYNNFIIIAGHGYPSYSQVIDDAITDINNYGNFDRLVIAVDSEDLEYADKHLEISEFISGKTCLSPIYIIIQHCCLETWALGNKRIISRNPQNSILKEYIRYYNIVNNDPELLGAYSKENLNRAQFAYNISEMQ